MQTAVAILLVLAAAAYLGRRLARALRATNACGCGAVKRCPAGRRALEAMRDRRGP